MRALNANRGERGRKRCYNQNWIFLSTWIEIVSDIRSAPALRRTLRFGKGGIAYENCGAVRRPEHGAQRLHHQRHADLQGASRAGPPGGAGGYVLRTGGRGHAHRAHLRRAAGDSGGAGWLPGPGSRAGEGLPQVGQPQQDWQGSAGAVPDGRRGVPGPARRVRRGRPHPGDAGSAGRALHRQRLPGQRAGHGQGSDQADCGAAGRAHPGVEDPYIH